VQINDDDDDDDDMAAWNLQRLQQSRNKHCDALRPLQPCRELVPSEHQSVVTTVTLTTAGHNAVQFRYTVAKSRDLQLRRRRRVCVWTTASSLYSTSPGRAID